MPPPFTGIRCYIRGGSQQSAIAAAPCGHKDAGRNIVIEATIDARLPKTNFGEQAYNHQPADARTGAADFWRHTTSQKKIEDAAAISVMSNDDLGPGY